MESVESPDLTAGEELRHLLDPITPEEFLAKYWQRKSLHIPGSPEKFHHLFSREDFSRAAAHQAAKGITIRASFDSVHKEDGVGVHTAIRAEEIDDYFNRGASICADPIDRGDPALAAYAAIIAGQLQYTGHVSVKAYLSPDGCGFNTHFDTGIATTLQIEGKKRWRFSLNPARPFPRSNALVTSDRQIRFVDRLPSSVESWERVQPPDESAFQEVILEPGDVLCLPAGVWHNAKAIGSSLAINLSFQAVNFFDFLEPLIKGRLLENAEWRRGVPASIFDPEKASDNSHLPASVADFFQKRLTELNRLVDEIHLNPDILADAWRRGKIEANPARQDDFGVPFAGVHTGAETNRLGLGWKRNQSSETRQKPLGGIRFDQRLVCTICVSNLDAAIDWYQSKLGFQLVLKEDRFGWGEMQTPTANVYIGLAEAPVRSPGESVSLNFGVIDLDATVEALRAAGVEIEGGVKVIEGVTKMASFRDRDGNRLTISQLL
jgi:ribosomal protein L16 Arg81 hydroxylase/catechol 2,3-dioxygenase-like lactoylglutathione lyase family enzyme